MSDVTMIPCEDQGDEQWKRKRVSLQLPMDFDFRYKRRTLNSAVDVGRTAELITEKGLVESNVQPHELIPTVVDLAVSSQRISVFYLLGEELDVPFSLDNGVVLQQLVY